MKWQEANVKYEVDILVLGAGILGCSVANACSEFLSPDKILIINGKRLAAPCSLSSTGIICKMGIKTGISPLGDLLSRAYDWTVHSDEFTHHGIEPSRFFTLAPAEDKGRVETLTRRYGSLHNCSLGQHQDFLAHEEEAFLVDPKRLIKHLAQDILTIDDTAYEVRRVDDYVEVVLASGAMVRSRLLFVAMGAYQDLWQIFKADLKAGNDQKTCKVVPGSFLLGKTNLEFLGRQSFVLQMPYGQLIKRADGTTMIGSTHINEGPYLSGKAELKMMKDRFEDLFQLSLGTMAIESGQRAKAPKRRPVLYALDNEEKVWTAKGLYKNGWTLGPLFGHEWAIKARHILQG